VVAHLEPFAVEWRIRWRAGRPILTCAKHQFRIDRIVTGSDDVTSVYLTGRQLDRFAFRSGQYANVVFLSKAAGHRIRFPCPPRRTADT